MASQWFKCRCGCVIWDLDAHLSYGACGAALSETVNGVPAPDVPGADAATVPDRPEPVEPQEEKADVVIPDGGTK